MKLGWVEAGESKGEQRFTIHPESLERLVQNSVQILTKLGRSDFHTYILDSCTYGFRILLAVRMESR